MDAKKLPEGLENPAITYLYDKLMDSISEIKDFPVLLETLKQLEKFYRDNERAAIVSRLKQLGKYRAEYLQAEVKHAGQLYDMSLPAVMVYAESHAAIWLAKIIGGDSPYGWLPSWRWEGVY